MEEKKLFGIFILLVLLILGSVATVSYSADPGGQFKGDSYYQKMVEILLSGYNITDYRPNFDWGKFREEYIRHDNKTRDLVILGSSHMMEMEPGIMGGIVERNSSYMNDWISGASLEDCVAVINLYAEEGRIPVTVVIGLEPWFLDSSTGGPQMPKKSLHESFTRGKIRIGYSPNLSEFSLDEMNSLAMKFSSLISQPILVASLGYYINRQSDVLKPTRERSSNESYQLNQDGTSSWPLSSKNKSRDAVDTKITEAIANREMFFESFSKQKSDGKNSLDPEKLKLFDHFISYLQSHGVSVIFYLSPPDIRVYQEYISDPDYRIILEEEQFFRQYAAGHGIQLIGSYNSSNWNLTPADYYDWSHLKTDSIARIFYSGK